MYRIWSERTLPPRFAPLLEGVAVVIGAASETPDTPLKALGEAQAVLASNRIRYDAAFMAQAPALQVISRTGIGIDNIVVPDASARGIIVCYAPEAPTISTAEHAVALLLAVAKDLRPVDKAMRAGGTVDFHSPNQGVELYGLQLGLVGLGRIGSHVAPIARAFGMRVVAFDPLVAPQRAADLGVELLPTLDTLLRTSDVVSLHLPLTAETRHLINAERLAIMKPGAILINAARGGLVDESALFDALERGHLHGAGLDVFAQEPPRPDHPLLQLDNVVATPHIASATIAGKDRLWQTSITQALQVLRGERPPHLVNPEVWPPADRS